MCVFLAPFLHLSQRAEKKRWNFFYYYMSSRSHNRHYFELDMLSFYVNLLFRIAVQDLFTKIFYMLFHSVLPSCAFSLARSLFHTISFAPTLLFLLNKRQWHLIRNFSPKHFTKNSFMKWNFILGIHRQIHVRFRRYSVHFHFCNTESK